MGEFDGAGPFTMLAFLADGVISRSRRKRHEREIQRAIEAAERESRRNEQRMREQWREWLAAVERQAAQVSAGDATREQARAALGGRGGGRRNPLDGRKYR